MRDRRQFGVGAEVSRQWSVCGAVDRDVGEGGGGVRIGQRGHGAFKGGLFGPWRRGKGSLSPGNSGL